jgi:hypothetical protein
VDLMATRITRPDTAFALSAGKKRPRQEDGSHLAFIRDLPCCICGAASEAAHIRYGALSHGKPGTGAGEKPSDKYCVPLCPSHHRLDTESQHAVGDERRWWQAQGIDPIVISALLWQVSGDVAAGTAICENARNVTLWARK